MKIIIVGGGFGSLKLARKLNNKKGFEILLIDKFNYHQFQPLFYQVATAGLDASNISFPLRKAFQKSRNIRIRITHLKQIVAAENKIITGTGEEHYDILVLATGADTNFFGNQQLEEHAFPMKSTVEALQLRYKLVQNFEDALTIKNEEELQRLLNIVVVGGGPTGVPHPCESPGSRRADPTASARCARQRLARRAARTPRRAGRPGAD